MFKWRWSADPIFLHCEVDVCNKTSEICTGAKVRALFVTHLKPIKKNGIVFDIEPEFTTVIVRIVYSVWNNTTYSLTVEVSK